MVASGLYINACFKGFLCFLQWGHSNSDYIYKFLWSTNVHVCAKLIKIHRYIDRYGKKLNAKLKRKCLKNNCIKVFQGNKKIQFILMQRGCIAAPNLKKKKKLPPLCLEPTLYSPVVPYLDTLYFKQEQNGIHRESPSSSCILQNGGLAGEILIEVA